MKLKHVLASQKDKKPTINNSDLLQFIDNNHDKIIIYYQPENMGLILPVLYHRSRNGSTWYPSTNWNKKLKLPKIGQPLFLDIVKCAPIETLFPIENLN